MAPGAGRTDSHLADRYGGTRLAAGLQEGLRQVRSIRVEADLGGTLQKPQCKFQSDLGPQLSDALSGMVRRELDARRGELEQLVQQTVEAELGRFDQMISAKEQPVWPSSSKAGST